MATYTSYDQVGKAVQIDDIVSNISPTKTPFLSSIGTENVYARFFEWEEDALRAVQANAQLEGYTAADATLTAMTSRTNQTQILEKTIKVANTADAIKLHGRKKETAYQLAKAAEEVKRDLENALVGVNQAAVVGSAGVARQMASVPNQIAAGTTIAGGSAALTEAKVLSMHQAVYNAGADISVLMVKPADSVIVANFATATGRLREITQGGTELVNSIRIYTTPFGSLKVVMNRFMLSTICLGYDPQYWKLGVLRPWFKQKLAITGDNEMWSIVGEYSLKHLNQSASGMVNAIT